MVNFAQIGECRAVQLFSAQRGRQPLQSHNDAVGEGVERIAHGRGSAARQARFERHHGQHEAMGIGEDFLERGAPLFADARFRRKARQRGFGVRAGQARGKPGPIDA